MLLLQEPHIEPKPEVVKEETEVVLRIPPPVKPKPRTGKSFEVEEDAVHVVVIISILALLGVTTLDITSFARLLFLFTQRGIA